MQKQKENTIFYHTNGKFPSEFGWLEIFLKGRKISQVTFLKGFWNVTCVIMHTMSNIVGQMKVPSRFGKWGRFGTNAYFCAENCNYYSNYQVDVDTKVCLTFSLNEEIEYVNVTGAEFWFYKKYDENDQFNQTVIISEIDHWDQTGSFEKYTVMAIVETTIRGEFFADFFWTGDCFVYSEALFGFLYFAL